MSDTVAHYVPYALLAVFFAVEFGAPKGNRGASEGRDRGTLLGCWLLVGGGFAGAFFLGNWA